MIRLVVTVEHRRQWVQGLIVRGRILEGVQWCVSREAEFIFEVTGEDLSVFCGTSFVTVF